MTCMISVDIHLRAALIDNRQCRIHLFGKEAGALHAAGIGRNHRQLRQVQFPEVIDQHRRRKQVIDRDVEKSLNLRRVQVHNQARSRPRS